MEGQSTTTERVRYRFLGHVQHRGFRYGCVMVAQKVGATGWVRNERDGTVTAEVQGSPEVQLEFVKRLSSLVPGYGDDWSIGTELPREVDEAETAFGVRR